jgi:hypothetical protein
MACACKVNQEIDKINKYYAYHGKVADENRPKMSINKKDAVITLAAYILVIPFIPLMIVFMLFFSIFSKDKKLSMRKFLGFIHTVRNGREKQIV